MGAAERQYRILIASNDAECRDLLTSALSDKDYRIVSLGEAGKALVAILDKEFDAVIVDLDLSGMTGLEAIQIIKRSRPKIPLIVISNDPSVETGSRVIQEGIFYYSVKPLNPNELSQAVQAALSRVSPWNSRQ